MTAQQIMMIYIGLLVLILVLGFIWGIIHGRRKSTYKLVTTIIFYTVFFLIIEKVAIAIVDFPFLPYLTNAGIQLPVEIEGAKTLKEACAAYLVSMGLTSDEIIPILMSFATVIAKIIFTLIYFIPIGLVYWLLVNIIYLCFFKRKKSRMKKLEKKMETNKVELSPGKKKKKLKLKEHRLTGGFLGLIKKVPQVIVIIAVTTGIISLIPTIKGEDNSNKLNLTVNIESNELIDLLEENGLGEYVKFVEMYRNSPFVKVLGGDSKDNKRLSGLIFDKLTQGKYENYTLDLQSEMAFIIGTSAKAYGITKGQMDINQLDTIQQKEMCALLKDLTDSELIMSLLPVGASVALSLQQVKDLVDQNVPGLELDPSILKDVNWEEDIENISDAAIALVDLSNGFQNLNNIDFLTLEPEYVNTLTKCISNITLLLHVIPVVVDFALEKPEVQELIGEASEQIKEIVWNEDSLSGEVSHVGEIYESFRAIGLTSFDNVLGQLTEQENPKPEDDKLLRSEELVTTLFESEFISLAFPLVFDKVIEGQDETVKQLFEGLYISEWDNELNTVIQLARDVRDNGGTITNLDLSIVRDVNVDTILRSELLTQGFTKMFTTYDDPGSIGEQIGLKDYIYVPEKLKEVNSTSDNAWYKKAEKSVDDEGNTIYKVEHRELADILTAFQKILPKEGEIDFNDLPDYILQISDYYLADEGEENRPTSDYSSIFDSLVLRTSISNMVMTNKDIKDMVIIPETASSEFVDKKVHVISINELNSMVKGIKALGIKDFTNIKPSYEMIENLKNDYVSNIEGDTSKITNLDMILSSDIVYSTFSNLLIDMEEKSDGVLQVPTDVLKPVKTFNEGEHSNIELKEIHNVVDAILVFENLDFENPQFTIDMVTELSDQKISTVSESSILRNTITNVLKDYDSKDTVVIPVSALGENHYITKIELNNMIKGIKVLPSEVLEAPDQLDMNALIKDLNNPSIKDDPTSPKNVKIILNSKIVHSTISKYLIDATTKSDGMIIIPTDVKLPEEDRLANTLTKSIQIESNELEKIVNAVNILPIDLANPNVSIDTLLDIYYVEETNPDGTKVCKFNEAIGDKNVSGIIDSAIINTTLTEVLIDQATPKEGQEAMIVIPDDDKLKMKPIDKINGFNYIDKVELQNVIKGFIALGIKDSMKPDGSIDISPNIIKKLEEPFEDTSLRKIDVVLNSGIVHTTLSNAINKAAKDHADQIYIPLISDKKSSHYTIDKITVLSSSEKFNNITREELIKVIHAFNLLDMDFDAGANAFDINTIFSKNDEEIAELVASNIINLTISNNLINEASKQDSVLVLPKSTFDILETYKFMKSEQVVNLIKGFNILLKDNPNDSIQLDNIKITTEKIKSLSDVVAGTTETKIEVVLKSEIVHATLSGVINDKFATPDSKVVIYDDVKIIGNKDFDNKDITLINKVELSNLVDAFNVLNIDLENPTFDASILLKLTDNDVQIIGESKIINGTITKSLIDIASQDNAFMVIPQNALKDNNKYITYKKKVTSSDPEPELINMINGIKSLGITDLNNVTITNEMIKGLNEESDIISGKTKIDVALQSKIVHSTISKVINDMQVNTPGLIIIPNGVKEEIKTFNDVVFNNITNVELGNLIKGFTYLNLNVTGENNINPSDLYSLVNQDFENSKLKLVLNSYILHSTVSKKILDLGEGVNSVLKIINHSKVKIVDDNVTYITKQELYDLIKSLSEILPNETDFGNIKFAPNLLDGKDYNIVFNSIIVRSTVSDMIYTNTTTKDVLDSELASFNVVSKKELTNLMTAFGPTGLNIMNSTSFNDGIDASMINGLTSKQVGVITNSKILHQKISDAIFGLNNLIVTKNILVDMNGNNYVSGTPYISVNELNALIAFAGDTQLGNIDYSQQDALLKIIADPNMATKINSSTIMGATLGTNLEALNLPFIPSNINIDKTQKIYNHANPTLDKQAWIISIKL